MYKIFFLVSVISGFCVCPRCAFSQPTTKKPVVGAIASSRPPLLLVSSSRFVSGFPIVFKLRCSGPQTVPVVDVTDQLAGIDVTWRSLEGKAVYHVKSEHSASGTVEIPGSGSFSAGSFYKNAFLVEVPKGQDRSILVDISSLITESEHNMGDIPPGRYAVTVRFNNSGLESTIWNVEILPPSVDEKDFLEIVSQFARKETRLSLNWSSLLEAGADLSQLDWKRLGQVAQGQLQFHLLLSKALSTKLPFAKMTVDSLSGMSIPTYLQPEKMALLLELNIIKNKDQVAKAITQFATHHPDLSWRIEAVRKGGKDLWKFKIAQ